MSKLLKLTDAREKAPMLINSASIDAVFTPPVQLKTQYLTANAIIKIGQDAVIAEESVDDIQAMLDDTVKH